MPRNEIVLLASGTEVQDKPIAIFRNWYFAFPWSRNFQYTIGAMLGIGYYTFRLTFIDKAKNWEIALFGLIGALVVSAYTWMYLRSFLIFFPERIVSGKVVKRWRFLSALQLEYTQIERVSLKTRLFCPVLEIIPKSGIGKIKFVGSRNTEDLVPLLTLLRQHLKDVQFDSGTLRLLHRTQFPDQEMPR